MRRAIVLVLDSFGIGSAPDADKFGDQGADTLGHIAAACARTEGRREPGPSSRALMRLRTVWMTDSMRVRGRFMAGL